VAARAEDRSMHGMKGISRCSRPSSFARKQRNTPNCLKPPSRPAKSSSCSGGKQSFTLLAQNEDWLAHNFDKIIHAQDVHPQDDDSVKPAAAKMKGEPRGS